MRTKLARAVYRAVWQALRWFYPKPEFTGLENLKDAPCIVVGNHAQMNGPIIGDVWFPGDRAIWCASQMMALKEVPAYAFEDFWSFKPKWTHGFYRLLSYVIAPLSVCLFNNARTIPVYRDGRVLNTYRQTVQRLGEGANVIIFPERNAPHNNIVYDFQEGFVDAARLYARRTGKPVAFVPMYVAPKLRRVALGKPIAYDPGNPPEAERRRVCDALMDAITALAREMPPHTVVPYRNIPRRDYPKNI